MSRFPNSTKWSVIWLILLAIVIVGPLAYLEHVSGKQAVVKEAQAKAAPQNNAPSQATVTPSSTPAEEGEQEAIEAYIRTIFGKDAKVAIAVSHVECNPRNKQYPGCQLKTSAENSIGIFQINIESDYAKVHFDKIPGKTTEEKIEWLKDPYHNTLMAFKIFKDSGWYPWSGYTSGLYLDHMGAHED